MTSMDKLLINYAFDRALKHDPDFILELFFSNDKRLLSNEYAETTHTHFEPVYSKPLTYMDKKQILYNQFWMIVTVNTGEELTWPFTCLTEQEAWDSIKSFRLTKSSCRAFFVDMELFDRNNALMLKYHALRKKERGF
jgi:hypothetical protein